MPSMDVIVRIDRVKEALDGKGFENINATHYDNTPDQQIVIHDDCGRVAHGEDQDMTRIIEDAGDEDGLWSALEGLGMTRKASVSS